MGPQAAPGRWWQGAGGAPCPARSRCWPDCRWDAGHGCPLQLREPPLCALGLSQATLSLGTLGAFGLCPCVPQGARATSQGCGRSGREQLVNQGHPQQPLFVPHSTHGCPRCSGTGCRQRQSPWQRGQGRPDPVEGLGARGGGLRVVTVSRQVVVLGSGSASTRSQCLLWGGGQPGGGCSPGLASVACTVSSSPSPPPFTCHFGLFAAQTDATGEAEAAHAEGAEPAV